MIKRRNHHVPSLFQLIRNRKQPVTSNFLVIKSCLFIICTWLLFKIKNSFLPLEIQFLNLVVYCRRIRYFVHLFRSQKLLCIVDTIKILIHK